MGTTMMLSHFTLRRGKKGGERLRVVGRPQRHNVLTIVYSFDSSQRASAWHIIVGLVYTHLETYWILFSPFLQFKLLPQFTPSTARYIYPSSAHHSDQWLVRQTGAWEKEKWEHTCSGPTLLPHLPVYYQSTRHSVHFASPETMTLSSL